ncbi:hypothetical protein [Succinimonas amylolytica]|uniref:hypothetical protein n=1 Tax=Succinimonas amylolytica TaxID=83769 RepID=UPI00035DE372|nr:hypothetical protein [Succinimonas amylolytica]
MTDSFNDRFPYGFCADVYLAKALEKLRLTHPWAEAGMFSRDFSYAVEEENGRMVFVRYCRAGNKSVREVRDLDSAAFIDSVISDNVYDVERANPVKEVFDIPLPPGISIGSDWVLEKYQFRTHELGGCSSMVQAGNRVTGGNREFFIPPEFFRGSFDDFLEQYNRMVPGAFGLDRDYLKGVSGLGEFLGFSS